MLLDGFYSFKTVTAFLHNLDLRILLQIFSHNASGKRFIIYDNCFHVSIFFVFAKIVAEFVVVIGSSVAGILMTTTKEFFSLLTSTRSFLANRRYSLLLTEFNPNPVPCGICMSAS